MVYMMHLVGAVVGLTTQTDMQAQRWQSLPTSARILQYVLWTSIRYGRVPVCASQFFGLLTESTGLWQALFCLLSSRRQLQTSAV